MFGSRVLRHSFFALHRKKIIFFKDLRAPPMPRNGKNLEKKILIFIISRPPMTQCGVVNFFSRILKNSLLFAVSMGENFKLDFLES